MWLRVGACFACVNANVKSSDLKNVYPALFLEGFCVCFYLAGLEAEVEQGVLLLFLR